MKTSSKNSSVLITFSFLTIFTLALVSCEDDNDTPGDLDPDLFGRWELVDSSGNITAYTFNSDGTAIQTLGEHEYNWRWRVEGDTFILFVDGGQDSAPIRYMIEGNQLFLWSDAIQDWGVPLTKVS